ncbi:acyl carrier protein [Anaerotignum lactatifermentans]
MEEATVIKIIAEQLGISEDAIALDMTFADLHADSLDLFQIIAALEETYDLEFDNDEAEKLASVGDIVAYIEKALEN